MRLTTVLLLATILQVSATGFAQRINLSKSKAPLKLVLRELRTQSGYDFVYEDQLLRKSNPVDIKVKDASIEAVLETIFKGQPLSYQIENRTVVIKEKAFSFLDRLAAAFAAIDVRGRVLDENGASLSGATIRVKGGTVSVISGSDGTFLLKNVDENATITITYTGYRMKEIGANKDLGTIRMELDVANLEEVAVTINTGYQRIKPEQSTGAVSQIGTKEFESRISTNFLDGLINRLPGLMINNNVLFNSTIPGGGESSRPLFNIRGISTMSANQNPLIVVDGYPTELTIDMIDPNEIKSVTILKDAAAATVYGVRASNGVIVIERKQATAGKANFTFRTTIGLTPKEDYSRYRWDDNASAILSNYQRTTQSTLVNGSSWGLLYNVSDGAVQRSAPYYILAQAAAGMITPQQMESSFAALANYDNLKDYSRLFLRTAVSQSNNLSVSGGNNNALYYITANYTGNFNSQVLNDNNRMSLAGRSTLKLSKKLSLELITEYFEQRSNGAPIPGIASIAPYERYQDVNGNPAAIIGSSISAPYNNYIMSQGLQDHSYYPLINMNEISDKTRIVNNSFNANFRYNFGSGFDLTFGGIYQSSHSEFKHLASERSSEVKRYINSYTVRNTTDGTLTFNIPKGGYLRQENSNVSSYTGRTQLNYNKNLGIHSFNVILGGEIRNVVNKGALTSSFGYNDESLLQLGVDYASITANSATTRGSFGLGAPFQNRLSSLFNQQYTEDRFLSGYSNIVYSYKNTYSATGSIRVDQSNLFGTNPKYKYKPLWSVGAAWNINKEDFMQNVNWVNLLKLRTSYGFNGNVAKLSLPEVIASSVFNNYTSPVSPALKLASYANSSLRWEQTNSFNTGLDFDIFKNITGSVDYYRKKSTDLLGNALIDPTLGVSPTLVNQATIRNNGIELGLNADWISTPKFNWNTGIVVARNTSKVLDVYRRGNFNPQTLNALGYVKGYPVGAMFGYNTVGLDSEGFPMIADQNGTLFNVNTSLSSAPITALMSSETSGLTTYSGSSIPTINGGLSNRIDVGNFYFFCMINYYGGFKVQVPRANPSATRALEGAGNYWKVAGDEQNTDIMNLTAFSGGNSLNAYNYARNYAVRGDYITLGDVTVSYSLEKINFLKKAGFNKFEIKAQASNLYTVGFNRYNYSRAAGSYEKSYMTPTYTLALFTNF